MSSEMLMQMCLAIPPLHVAGRGACPVARSGCKMLQTQSHFALRRRQHSEGAQGHRPHPKNFGCFCAAISQAPAALSAAAAAARRAATAAAPPNLPRTSRMSSPNISRKRSAAASNEKLSLLFRLSGTPQQPHCFADIPAHWWQKLERGSEKRQFAPEAPCPCHMRLRPLLQRPVAVFLLLKTSYAMAMSLKRSVASGAEFLSGCHLSASLR